MMCITNIIDYEAINTLMLAVLYSIIFIHLVYSYYSPLSYFTDEMLFMCIFMEKLYIYTHSSSYLAIIVIVHF